MDRRQSLQWMLAAAAMPTLGSGGATAAVAKKHTGYGTDPDLVKRYRGGELWPLAFDAGQLRCAAALCALIIPADDHSPSAADLEVQSFIDEWVSAPYPAHAKDKAQIVEGLAWLDAESKRRYRCPFADAEPAQQSAIADEICSSAKAPVRLAKPAAFFARFRDLAAGGFYTTPAGMKDLGFVGNTPSATFEGPPRAVIDIVGVN